MKRFIKYTFIASSILFIMSCEGILDKAPLGRSDLTTTLQNEDDAIEAINAAYEFLLFSPANNNFYWVFGTVASDIAIAGGDGSRSGIVELDFLSQTPGTQELTEFWVLNYSGITQCNTVIDKVSELDIDELLKDRILGEALFLRAYYYFGLSQVFGGVPKITELLAPDEYKMPKVDKQDILLQVVEDCISASEKLPVENVGDDLGRATKGAALALAAKAYLYLEEWDIVLEYVDKIKDLGLYQLVADYGDNFRKESQNNSESIFEVQHTNLELGVGNSLNQWYASKKYGTGYGFAEVTPEYVEMFEPDDPRLKYTVAMNGDDYFGLVYKKSFSSTTFGPKKFLQADEDVSQKADGDINYPAIRFAEVLLWEAEANVELGNSNEALVPLEEVRARARNQSAFPDTTLLPITTTDLSELKELVRKERALELGYEMHRFFDLVRWGIAKEVLPDFQVGKNEVFPIPQSELDLNPLLEQNPGY